MRRKLPSPDTLYNLVTDRGLSYSEIAMKYGVTKTAVIITLKGDCRRAGIEWPIKRNPKAGYIRGVDTQFIDSFALKLIVEEFLEDTGLSRTKAAPILGVSRGTIDRILTESTYRVRIESAKAIMQALDEPMPTSLKQWATTPNRIRMARDQNHKTYHDSDTVLDEWQFLREQCGWRSAQKIADKLGMTKESLARTLYRYRDDPRVGDLTWVFLDDNQIPKG